MKRLTECSDRVAEFKLKTEKQKKQIMYCWNQMEFFFNIVHFNIYVTPTEKCILLHAYRQTRGI